MEAREKVSRSPVTHVAPPTPRSSPFFAADSLRRAGFSTPAARRYRALRDSFQAAGERERAAEAGLRLADALLVTAQAAQVRAVVGEVLERVRGRDIRREASARLTAAALYLRQGHADSAGMEAGTAVELARRADEPRLAARGEELIARAALAAGRSDSALAAAGRALAALEGERPGPGTVPPERAAALYTLGRAQARRGLADAAHAALEDARRAYVALGDTAGVALARFELVRLETAAGNAEEALDVLLEALSALEIVGRDLDQLVRISNRIAELYLALDEPGPVGGYVSLAREELGFTLEELRAEQLLGRANLAEGRPREAVGLLAPLVRRADSLDALRLRVTARANLARALTAMGELERAIARGREATGLADSLGEPEAQTDALGALAGALEAAGSTQAEATYLRGIEVLERWRAGVRAPALRMGILEPRLALHEGAIRLRLSRNEVEGAFEVAERARARGLLEGLGADLGAAVSRALPALPRTMERLVGPDRALLAYFWGDRAVYGWWSDGDGLRAARLGAPDSLASSVEFLRSLLEDPSAGPDWHEAAHYAFRRFVEPLAPSAAREVVVVPDGPLAYVPVETFVARPGAPPWGSTRVLSYAPSATALAGLNRRSDRTPEWDATILVVGDPTYEGEATRTETESMRPGDAALPPLPHARREAKAIAGMYRGENVRLLLGDEATPEQWLATEPGRFRYLHFASHALVHGRDPGRSRIVLSGGSLGLDDLRRLPLSAELVVLSGCETALGPRVRGEGVVGLPHAFLTAGAGAVVVTLWRVEDRSSADYMTAFYRELRAGRSFAAALHRVRRKWIAEDGRRSHPSRWAPFILVGGAGEEDRRPARARSGPPSSRRRAARGRSLPSSTRRPRG